MLSVAVVMFSCGSNEHDFLSQSLTLAGTNRGQLEYVLSHYKKEPSDSLHLRAAEFLIGNMSAHFSYLGDEMEKYYNASDSISILCAKKGEKEIKDAFNSLGIPVDQPQIVHDLLTMPADYLIYNINRAFETWRESRYAKHLSFDDFCEYLLPYKVCELQTPDNWREYLTAPLFGDLSNMEYCKELNNSAFAACDLIDITLRESQPETSAATDTPPVRRLSSLLKTLKRKDCEDIAIEAAAVMRAKGVPVSIDFTPVWSDSHAGHVWCSLKDNGGKSLVFGGYSSPRHLKTTAKIFRRTYGINRELLDLKNAGYRIPPRVGSLCVKDVTDEYFDVFDIDVRVLKNGAKVAYLATFNDRDWEPVMWGKVTGNKARFEKMGRDAVYLPVVFGEDGELKPVADPFILNRLGDMEELLPDKSERQTLRLYRKHPVHPVFFQKAKDVAGSWFEASDRPDFGDATVIHVLSRFATESDEIKPDTARKFRYWRYRSNANGFGGMAELYFFRNGENITKQGRIIGIQPKENSTVSRLENVFDGDPVSYWEVSAPKGGWVGMDFGSPVAIDRIIYIPRCDGNGVTFGDRYELKYWDSGGWISLGYKVADNIYVEFENCPEGALFLLHNCTRGVEERIFTYKDGNQIWW
ncbi:MAG: discoidin domain-containing protein [Dysgonamonadaceae bacterium]|nr:discoidin domain-containing protein [Dysgonamonadaceae bacterium]